MEILLRFGIALLFILAGIIAYRWVTSLRLMWLRRTKQNPMVTLGGRVGVPAILYFTTPDCAPCKAVQGPAIESLLSLFGEQLQIIKIDASERNDLADAWGVLSVPTTFIIDAQGQPRHVNNGVVSVAKLRQQLREFGGLDGSTEKSVPIKSPIKLKAQ